MVYSGPSNRFVLDSKISKLSIPSRARRKRWEFPDAETKPAHLIEKEQSRAGDLAFIDAMTGGGLMLGAMLPPIARYFGLI